MLIACFLSSDMFSFLWERFLIYWGRFCFIGGWVSERLCFLRVRFCFLVVGFQTIPVRAKDKNVVSAEEMF